MNISIKCPTCDAQYDVDVSRLGSRVRCKKCDCKFTLQNGESGREASRTSEKAVGDTDYPSGDHHGLAHGSGHSRRLPSAVGRFEIRALLGSGAFGSVYQGYDPVLDRDVAIKVPNASVMQSTTAQARFLREPKAAAQLYHPHIVPVFETGRDGDRLFITSAFVAGKTLEETLEKSPPGLDVAVQTVRSLAKALQYAHEMGIVHRDVKPSNIMMDQRGQPLLMDFGLARLQNDEEKLTQDGTIMGTPAYLAPEQADSRFGDVGPASDQYSLGVVLHELLCGERPFSGPPSLVIFRTLNHEPDRPSKHRPGLPQDLETICLKSISKHPDDRYANCELLAEDLRRWLDDEPIHARRMSLVERTTRWTKKNPVVAALSCGLIVVAVAAIVTFSVLYGMAASQRQIAERRLGEVEREKQRAETNLAEADRQRLAAQANLDEANAQRTRAEDALVTAAENLAEAELQRAEADRQRAVATGANEAEQAERSKAQSAAELAQAAQKQAEDALADAERERNLANERANQLRRLYFNSQMRLASDAWTLRDMDRCKSILTELIPGKDDEDLRSFAWYYLAAQSSLLKPIDSVTSIIDSTTATKGGQLLQIADGAVLLRFSADGKYLAAANYFGQDFDDNRLPIERAQWKFWEIGGDAFVTGNGPPMFAFSPDANYFAFVYDKSLTMRKIFRTDKITHSRDVPNLAFLNLVEDLKFIESVIEVSFEYKPSSVSAYKSFGNHTANIFTTDGMRILARLKHPGQPHDVDNVALWDWRRSEAVAEVKTNTRYHVPMMLADQGRKIIVGQTATSGKALPLVVWDVDQNKEIHPVDPFHLLTVAPDGMTVIGKTAILNLESGQVIQFRAEDEPREVWIHGRPACSPDSRFVADRLGNEVRVWDLKTGGLKQTLAGHRSLVTSVSFHPDGKTLATASRDRTIKIWDVESGSERATLKLHTDPVTAVTFSPAGSTLVSSSENGSIRFWYAAAREN